MHANEKQKRKKETDVKHDTSIIIKQSAQKKTENNTKEKLIDWKQIVFKNERKVQ